MIHHNKSLKKYNTFGLSAKSGSFINLMSESQLLDLIQKGELSQKKVMFLGSGSNVLFISDFEGLIIHPEMNAISVMEPDSDYVHVSCEAGAEWDGFIKYCVSNNYGGLENLSYIPGSVGAAPIQNIGAYGVEVSEYIESVRTINIESGKIKIFKKEDCRFGYRNSIFKTELKGRYFISSVTFKLKRNPVVFNLSYGVVKERLSKKGKATLSTIRETIIEIRKEKLPEPDQIGNAGSFFKNPLIDLSAFDKLSIEYKDIPSHKSDKGEIKIPAGWLIEKCGWKGYRRGDAGVHEKQALVLVNYGSATGAEIYSLANDIVESVSKKFAITLEHEVNII